MQLTKIASSITATIMVAASFTLVSAPAEAASKNTVRANPAKPIANEKFTVTGKLSTAVKRKAYLQLKSGGKWKKADTDTTSSSGAYKLQSRTKIDRSYRIVAPATTVKGKKYKRINGPARTIRVVTQAAKIKVSNVAPIPGEVIEITGTFTPARKGRTVTAFIKVGSATIKLGSAKQNSSGRARWTALTEVSDVGQPANFYVRALAAKGAPLVTSSKVVVTARN